MTTMELTDFIKLGFNKNEAKVYLSLIKFGTADANQIIKDTKFHKNIVYDNLEKLIDKGLVSFIVEEGRKVFTISPPNSLPSYIEEQEKIIKDRKELSKRLAKEIKSKTKEVFEKQEAAIYRGIKSVKSFYEESLRHGSYLVIGAPKESLEVLGAVYWENYNLKRKERKISVKMIFNPSIREHGEKLKNKYTEIKYFGKDFEPLTEIHIQGDLVATVVWTKEPILFKINSKFVAESYKKYFEDMWRKAKR